MERLAPEADEHLVFLGDYIDRGPNSRGVIDRCLDLQKQYQCTFLRGNHETYMIDFMEGRHSREEWAINGGADTLCSYGNKESFPPEHGRFLYATQSFLDTSDYFFVHGGLLPEKTVAENIVVATDAVFLWQRPPRQGQLVAWEKTVVFGHTPVPRPLRRHRMIGIDTGCVYVARPGLGFLTAVRLPAEEYVSVPNRG